MSEPVLLVQRDGGILTLSLNRPEKRNALSGALVDALREALTSSLEEEEVRVILLRGEGSDFCSGADLGELENTTTQGREESLAEARRLGELLLLMRRHPRPIVAAVQGRALAGGCGLATACDLILAREDAQFGYPEVHLGFVPAMVMAILRHKVTESRAFELVTLGRRITAKEAEGIGLVTRVLGAETFQEEVKSYVAELAGRPPSAVTLTKGLLYELADLPVAEGVERGAQVNVQARMTEACREGVRSFLARGRRPGT